MKPTIQDVSAGERPSAGWSNQVKDAACHDHAGAAHSDPEYHVFSTPATEALELYELTAAPTLDDDAREYKATAKPVALRHVTVDGSGHWTANSAPSASSVLRFRMQTTYLEETIWFPTGSRDSDAEADAAHTVESGDRVWTLVVQGIRVAVVGSQSGMVVGKLDGSLSQGGTATVSVWEWNGSAFADRGDNITVHDWLMKVGATAIASGKKVTCVMMNGIWVVWEAECP